MKTWPNRFPAQFKKCRSVARSDDRLVLDRAALVDSVHDAGVGAAAAEDLIDFAAVDGRAVDRVPDDDAVVPAQALNEIAGKRCRVKRLRRIAVDDNLHLSA